MWGRAAVVLSFAGCNLVFEADPGPSTDAPPIGTCPWSTPRDVVGTNPDDTDPAVSDDEKLMVVARPVGGTFDLIVLQRDARDLGFHVVPQMSVSASGVDDTDPTLSADGTDLMFLSKRAGAPGIYATRDEGNGFASPFLQIDLGDTSSSSAVALSGDGRRVYFTRGGNIVMAERQTATSAFGTAKAVGFAQQFFAISPNERELFTYRDAAIQRALRADLDDAFGEPEDIGLVGENPALADGGKAMYFTSGGKVRVARRDCLDGQ